MLEEKIKIFLEKAGPIFFVTPAVGRAIGMETEPPDFHIICAKESEDIDILKQAGVKVLCLQKDIRGASKILANPKTVDYIKRNSVGKRANVVTFKPSPMIEKICEENDFRYLGNKSALNREFEDKIRFAEVTSELGVPNANSRILKIEKNTSSDFLDFSEKQKYVIQFSYGYSGNSSFLIKSLRDFEKILKNNIGRRIKITDYKEGETYTLNVCIGKFGTLLSQPIFQITGFSDFNKNTLGTCGNDYEFGKKLSEKSKKRLKLNIERVAKKLCQNDYRGFVGFDFQISDDEINLIEINPRLVGSVPVFTKLQIFSKETPFLLLHILSFLDFDFSEIGIKERKRDFMFSQIILRNISEKDVKIKKTLKGGIYKFDKGKILFQKEAYCGDKKMGKNDFFLDCSAAGSVIGLDVEYANIQFGYGIMEEKGKLKNFPLEIIKSVMKEIILH